MLVIENWSWKFLNDQVRRLCPMMCCPIRNRVCKNILDYLQVELDKFEDAIIYTIDIHDERPDWML